MNVVELTLSDLKLISPKIWNDSRGYFYESYNKRALEKCGIACDFVQDNQSYSKYGTLRGLHFQKGEHAQAKLVRVLKGQVLDITVDLRPKSVSFGKQCSVLLTAEEHKQLFIPRGFAHGFVVLSPDAVFEYKCDNYYNKEAECGIIYNDSTLKIDWKIPASELVISEKDLQNLSFENVRAVL